ncbi:VWA domain-containing protein [bacterium]|nr:VWA domain-containing protein [bacterium]
MQRNMCTGTAQGLTRWLSYLLLSIGLAAAGNYATAQPAMEITRVNLTWPDVEVFFRTSCSHYLDFRFDRQNLQIFDQGNELRSFDLECPDQTQHCPMSVALVFDGSESMQGSNVADARNAANRFIGFMDGMTDEATIISYNDSVTVLQTMNSDKGLLLIGAASLRAAGEGRLLWDGARAGLDAVVSYGMNKCRAVILVVDGIDKGSVNTPQTLIELATDEQIRIFTVAMSSVVRTQELQLIAERTGGGFFLVTPQLSLNDIVSEISTAIMVGFGECRLAYTADCADGLPHEIRISTLLTSCNAVVADSVMYTAPLDISTRKDLRLGFEDRTGYGEAELEVPLELRTPLTGKVIPPMLFTLKTDGSCLNIMGVTFDSSDLWSPASVVAQPTESGLRVVVNEPVLVHGSGALLRVRVRLRDVNDTTCCSLRIENVNLAYGCLQPVIEEGTFCIIPRRARIDCSIDAPASLQWDDLQDIYVPAKIRVTARFTNYGTQTASDLRYTLEYDTSAIASIEPTSPLRDIPKQILPGDTVEVHWDLLPRHVREEVTTLICIEAEALNAGDARCCADVLIEQARRDVSCTLEVPPLRADTLAGVYKPQPLTVTATVKNEGQDNLQGIAAKIFFVSSLDLAGADAPDRYRKALTPTWLAPGDSSSVQWEVAVQPPLPSAEVHALVRVQISTLHGDSTEASYVVRIPAMKTPFRIALSTDDPLEFCEGDMCRLDAGKGYAAYAWSTGERTRSIIVRQSGSYSCSVQENGGRWGHSDTLEVLVRPRPEPRLTTRGSNPICEGDTIILSTARSYASYLWSNGSTTSELKVTRTGMYSVSVTDSTGCSGRSDTLAVAVVPVAAVPAITRNLDVLTCTRAVRYQWRLNGVDIPGETNQFLALDRTGSYSVMITDSNGCTAVSTPYDVSVLDLDDAVAPQAQVDVYPNPSTGNMTVVLRNMQNLHISMYDMLGRCVWQEVVHDAKPQTPLTLPLAGRPSGVYLLRINADGKQYLKCLVVQRP